MAKEGPRRRELARHGAARHALTVELADPCLDVPVVDVLRVSHIHAPGSQGADKLVEVRGIGRARGFGRAPFHRQPFKKLRHTPCRLG